jgi:hypothetical protein
MGWSHLWLQEKLREQQAAELAEAEPLGKRTTGRWRNREAEEGEEGASEQQLGRRLPGGVLGVNQLNKCNVGVCVNDEALS